LGWLLFGCGGGGGMFISRVGIITLSFALGRAWGRLFFAPVSVGNMIKGKKSNIAAQKKENEETPSQR
jgi:hypothetical protein